MHNGVLPDWKLLLFMCEYVENPLLSFLSCVELMTGDGNGSIFLVGSCGSGSLASLVMLLASSLCMLIKVVKVFLTLFDDFGFPIMGLMILWL